MDKKILWTLPTPKGEDIDYKSAKRLTKEEIDTLFGGKLFLGITNKHPVNKTPNKAAVKGKKIFFNELIPLSLISNTSFICSYYFFMN